MADAPSAASSAFATAVATAAAAATTGADADSPPFCDGGNEYNGYFAVRVSAIFVILVGSLLGMTCKNP